MQTQRDDYFKTHISTATTTQVATGTSRLIAIVVNTTAADTIGILDNTTGSTVNVGELQASVLPGTYTYNIIMAKGIRIITAAASDITVIYSKT